MQQDTVRAVERARDAGFEWLQMHFAHGYLAQNFFSPLSNHRTDQYGGSAENRARYLLETLVAVRKAWPADRPLAVRLGAVEYFTGAEALTEEAIALLRAMKQEGLDFVDVSAGFNSTEVRIPWGTNFIVPATRKILDETGLPGSTSWYVTRDAREADALVRDGELDLVTYGRPFLDDPHLPFHFARDLELTNAAAVTMPAPYSHWVSRYR